MVCNAKNDRYLAFVHMTCLLFSGIHSGYQTLPQEDEPTFLSVLSRERVYANLYDIITILNLGTSN